MRSRGRVFGSVYSVTVVLLLAVTAFLIPFYFLEEGEELEKEEVAELVSEEITREERLVSFGDLNETGDLGKDISGIFQELIGEELIEEVQKGVGIVIDEEKLRGSFQQLRNVARPGL